MGRTGSNRNPDAALAGGATLREASGELVGRGVGSGVQRRSSTACAIMLPSSTSWTAGSTVYLHIGPEQDYHAIFRAQGGTRLDLPTVDEALPERAPPGVLGLGSAFAGTVLSSDGRSITSSSRLFERARAAISDAQRTLFVGDSWDRDIVPVKQLGWPRCGSPTPTAATRTS